MKFVETPEPIYVETDDAAQTWKEAFADGNPIGFDTETTGLDIINDRVKFFSIANADNRICAPVRLLPVFKDLLEDPTIEKRMTNAKYDMHMAANHGVHIQGRIADTICMDFLIDENRHGRHGLKETSKDYLGLRMAPFAAVFGNLKGGKNQSVIMLGKMHDCIESKDIQLATQILAELGKVRDTDPDVVDGINRITASIAKDYTYTPKTLLSIGRKVNLCGKTAGRLGYVFDICEYMGFDMDDFSREENQWVLDNEAITVDMHDKLLADMTQLVGFAEDPIEMLKLIVADYASLDAWASYSLVDVMEEELSQIELFDTGRMYNLLDLYNDWFVDLLGAAWDMERTGFKVDVNQCKSVEKRILQEIADIEQDVASHMKRVINLNSSAQLKEYFYKCQTNGAWSDLYGNPVKFWSKGGTGGKKTPSTGIDALEYFAEKGEQVATMILEHRKLKKIQEFVHNFPINADTNGRLHSTLNIVGARTGRWSSRDPNMQNIPSKGELGSLVRSLFIPEKENTLIVADYGQLEMRIMAHYANEPEMIKAIAEGKDLHSMTAALAAGYDYDAVVAAKDKKDNGEQLTDEEKELCNVRRNMKAVGFGLNYGIGAVKLGRQLGLPIEETVIKGKLRENCAEGQQLIDDYFGVYKNINKYIEDIKEYANEHQYVQTLSGRYRRLPEINSSEFWIKAKAQRQAGNTVIQGSAIDIMNSAVLKLYRNARLKELNVRMLLQVHDELIFECPDDELIVAEAKEIIQECMEKAWDLKVPLEAKPGNGPNWEKAK